MKKTKHIKLYSVDELNNMQLEKLEELEDKLWCYRKKVKVIIALIKELDKEED